jgi:hypothetical protein
MKVFIPHKKDPNPYFAEIQFFSEIEYVFMDFKTDFPNNSIINIHWPEALLDWKLPSRKDLDDVENILNKWKQNSKIVYTRHDSSSNFSANKIYEKLFLLIEKATDAFIHLGEFSKTEMEKKYPFKEHVVISHPLYEKSFEKFSKTYARKQLNIAQDALVMIAPGRIRHVKERNMVLSAFNSISNINKTLLSNRMLPFQSDLSFRGKHRINKYINLDDLRIKSLLKIYQPPKYIFNYDFADYTLLSLMMSASDFVFIPRLNILNSGNVFLAFTFSKPVIGPFSGNITEQLNEFKFSSFDPSSSKSINSAVEKVINLINLSHEQLFGSLLDKYHPKQIAFSMDEFFKHLRTK